MLELALGTTAWTRSQQQRLCDQRYPELPPFCAPAPGLDRNFKQACSFLTVGPAEIGLTYFLIPPLPQSPPATQTVGEMIMPGSLPCPCVHLCPVGHRFLWRPGSKCLQTHLGFTQWDSEYVWKPNTAPASLQFLNKYKPQGYCYYRT